MRYFIVFYHTPDGYAHISYECETFPNRTKLYVFLSNELRIAGLRITNIIELNETDYNNWIK